MREGKKKDRERELFLEIIKFSEKEYFCYLHLME